MRGNFCSASERVAPPLISTTIFPIVSFSTRLCVCVSSTCKSLSIATPALSMERNCFVKSIRSATLTRPEKNAIPDFIPAVLSPIFSGIRPRATSILVASSTVAASTSPVTLFPLSFKAL